MATHELVLAGGLVTKRFRSHRRDEHRRESVGLQLLDRHAPGLAPRPISCDLDNEPPTVTMTRLPGRPGHDRNTPATRRTQAQRVLDLLG